MQTANLEEARHGWNVVYDGLSYPFKTYNAASKLLNALYLLTSQDMLTQFKRLRAFDADRPVWSLSYFKENEEKVEGVIAQARVNVLKSSFSPEPGLGKTVFFLSDRHIGHPKLAVKLDVDSVLNEKWPSTPFRPFKGFNYAQQEERVLAQQASPAPAPVVVESIDPRKLPLFHYVNAEFLPDPPKDKEDTSTEACYKRQVHTIRGLLADLEKRTEDLTQERTSHEITKSKLAGADKAIQAQNRQSAQRSSYIDVLCTERDAYKGQVLKNAESIAVVKYSQRDHEWHLVQNGIVWRALYSDSFNTLVHIANSINLGKNSVGSFGLIRKPYYYKEDYV